MSVPAWRTVGYAGLIAAGLWFAFAGSVVAAAQPSDTDGTDSGATRSAPAADPRPSPTVSAPTISSPGSASTSSSSPLVATRPAAAEARRDRLPSDSTSVIRLGRGERPGIDVSPNGIRVRVGAQQVRVSGAHDEPTGPVTAAAAPAAQSAGASAATVRGTLQPQLVAESVPAPEPVPEPGVDSRPPPVLEGRPGLGAPPSIEGRPGPGLGAAPLPATPPAVPAPENPPAVPAPENPPVEPPVIDVTGPATGGGGGGRGPDTSLGGSPQPIRAPLAIPAPRIGTLPAGPAAPVLPMTPPGAPAAPGIQALLPPAGTSGVAPRSGSGAANPAGLAPRGATPAVPVHAPGTPVARTDVQRLGYPQYLRSARGPQIAAVALPGVAGLALLTVGGGVVGYRQASAGRTVRVSAAQRFLP